MFFTVSGGPFGLEGLVGSVGPGVAVLLLVATPLIYSVPEALLIGELAPFGVLAAVALVRWLGQPATPFPATPFHAARTSFLGALGIGISQSIWNYSGWDNASTIGGEIEQASATYPRALARTLPLVTAVYLLTILPALALTDWTTWTDGAWPRIAGVVVGPWLGVWIAGAGLVSAFALFNALLLAY